MGTAVQIENIGHKINDLHSKIRNDIKNAILKAIKVGELLIGVKNKIDHGEFGAWILAECEFSESTAKRYMGLFKFQNVIKGAEDFADAYKAITDERKRLALIDNDRVYKLIAQYERTGKKPEGWDNACEYYYRKMKEEETVKEERQVQEDENDLSMAGLLGPVFVKIDSLLDTEQPRKIKKIMAENISKYCTKKLNSMG